MVCTRARTLARASEMGSRMPGARWERPQAHLLALTMTLPLTVSDSPWTFAESVT